MMRRVLVLLAAAAVGLSLAGPAAAASKPLPAPPKGPYQTVDSSLFGMHVATLADNDFPGRLGGVRLWDSGVRWDQVETSQGVYNWTRLDKQVAAAKKAGVKEITYVLGSTPEWAASHVRPNTYYYGGGTASEPKQLSYWRDWVRAVATRYKGQITSYQIWNEANLASFWAPEVPKHWQRMALLTQIAADEIRAIDSSAKIVSASSTVMQSKKFATESFFYRYLRSVAKRKIRLNAISLHLYPWTTKGPGGGTPESRLKGLKMARQVIDKLGLSSVPIWDTEVNYGNQRDNGHPQEVFSSKVGSAYLARTYVDSLRYGVSKVFWYSWDSYVMGITTTDPATGVTTGPGTAFFTTEDWLTGARWGACKDDRVTICSLKRGSAGQYILYANLGTTRSVTLPKKYYDVTEICYLDGSCEALRGRTLRISQAPVLLK